MIDEHRRKFWRSSIWTTKKWDNDPFSGAQEIALNVYKDADVLEIGPGIGRAYSGAARSAKSWSFADITNGSRIFLPVSSPFYRIEKYMTCPTPRNIFDVVTFWYVVHHVRRDELRDFAWMVHCAAKTPFARILFNAPNTVKHGESDDGIGTTIHTEDEIREAFDGWSLIKIVSEHEGQAVYLGERVGDAAGEIRQ